ncbi:MAG: hypothetical protein IPL53_21440 [Ignavibacteria bacterium]|nr:hypothetical protein [Ignavibacteria bacterium]
MSALGGFECPEAPPWQRRQFCGPPDDVWQVRQLDPVVPAYNHRRDRFYIE